MNDSLISIGELARRSGVPVKTLRYYSDIGIVPPAERTASGYRLYGEEERLRLETVRTMRGLGFGLDQIAGALERRRDLRETIAMQVRAVESRIGELRRVAVVLRTALERADEPTSAHLARLETLARLSTAERTALLDDFLEDVARNAPADTVWRDWWAGFREASLPELPDNPTDEQLNAWLELAELLADADYRRFLREMIAGERDVAEPSPPDQLQVLDDALAARQRGITPEDPAADALVARFVALQEPVVGAGPDLERRVLEHIERHDDPRHRRYWELIGRIRGWSGEWPQERAFDWLHAALRARVR